jgi:acyl dehydratase
VKLASSIVGEIAGPIEHHLDARWLMAYSAGLGETDERYYDTSAGHDLGAHPLFPVCYEWPVSLPIRDIDAIRPHGARLVHAQHDLVIHRAPRAGDTVRTTARIIAAEQRSPGAFVVYRFTTVDRDGRAVTTSDFGALYRGVPLDGASRRDERIEDPPAASAPLTLVGDIAVAATAAHVYTECARIWNPIHTDVAYARAAGLPNIILHGTATLALSVSKAMSAFGLRPASVKRVTCRFSGMVLMPSTLTLHAARERGSVFFETRNARGEPVITRARLLLE